MTKEEYKQSIELLRSGFVLRGRQIRPNDRIASVEMLQAVLGLRLGDVLNLRMNSFVKDGSLWKLDIREEKTGKVRNFTVPIEVYTFIQDYAYANNIGKDCKLFPISTRQVEMHLSKVFQYMNLSLRNHGSHSYRKFFSQRVYLESDYDIELVRVLLQHSDVRTTQRYLGIGKKQVEEDLASTSKFLV